MRRRGRRRPTDAMQGDWDARSRADALYHVDATRDRWRTEEFYARGPELVALIVDPVLALLDVDPAGRRVLEVGCGVGRLFEGLAARFGEVWGIDVSPEMVARGRASCPVPARWLVGDGQSLAGVDDHSVDHVLSFEVFQHIPERTTIETYIAETFRVLRPGGTFQLQLRAGSDSVRQTVLRALPRPWRRAAGPLLRLLRLSRVPGDIDSWIGCVVPMDRAQRVAAAVGLGDVTTLPDEVHPAGMGYWLVGRKPFEQPG
ncbi:MAG: methyltransferase domain-containing protein [Acidimicrobiia bacterium]|nr:methyltransferase domain-containing protein [Acidimicrobiia bacterium]